MLLTLVDPHRGLRGRVQPLVRARPLLRGLHDRPVPVRRQPLGRDARAQGSPLAGRRRDGREARPTPARTSRSTSSSAATTSDHFDDWARPQVNALYADGRGFAERRHVHTVLFDHLGAQYRDEDPVPIELALDHGYDGIVARAGSTASTATRTALHRRARGGAAARSARRLATIEIASSWTPSAGENEPRDVPMDLGSKAGGPERLLQTVLRARATSATRSPPPARRTPTRVEPRPVWRRRASSRRSSAPSSAPTPTSTTSGKRARLCEWRVAVAMRICGHALTCWPTSTSPRSTTRIAKRKGLEGNCFLQMLSLARPHAGEFRARTSIRDGTRGRPSGRRTTVDPPLESTFVVHRRRRLARSAQLSWPAVAKEVGVSPATLKGLAQARRVGFPGVMRIVDWVPQPAANFTVALPF